MIRSISDAETWTAIFNRISAVAQPIVFLAAIAAAFFSHSRYILRSAVILLCLWLIVSFTFNVAYYSVSDMAPAFWPATAVCFAYFGFCITTCFTRLPSRLTAAAIHSIVPPIYGWVITTVLVWPLHEIAHFALEPLPLILLWTRLYDLRSPQTVA